MTIVLDFDRTIFDTEAFIEHFLGKHPELRRHLEEMTLAAAANEYAQNGTLRFEKGELNRFLYSDAVPFFARCGREGLILMTWGIEALQRAKIESLDIEQYFARIVYTPDLKGIALKRLLPLPEPIVFVDDDGMQLDSVAAEVPQARRVWMKKALVRAAPTSDCAVVGSMEELGALLRNL